MEGKKVTTEKSMATTWNFHQHYCIETGLRIVGDRTSEKESEGE